MKDNTAIVLLFASWLAFIAFLMVTFSPWFALLLIFTSISTNQVKGEDNE